MQMLALGWVAELGYLALLAVMVLSLLQGLLPLLGVLQRRVALQQLAPSLTQAAALAGLVSFACLLVSFGANDFSLTYVAGHSNTLMPWYYRLSAAWGGHEGSMLLWVVILNLWAWAVSLKARTLPLDLQARVLSILGLIGVAMSSFVVFTSSPFARSLPMLPVDGAELNPLLQDPGLIFHPPMLYMGYVGLAVPFAFAMAGLWAGRLDSAWMRWSRPWALAAWGFLTLGIALGSWWAYYELGWGGWWFWDPVENASFMPWLAGTALLHSMAVTEKRGVFKAWTVWLAILSFALSLLGTFLVRSGVLTSVHAFAADPQRGLYVLGILVAVAGGGLLMFALRGWQLTAESRYQLRSRESLLMVNNLILLVATVVVLIGTLYPLIAEALKLGMVSVGPPYFNALFVPLTWLLLAALGLGSVTRWKRDSRPLLGVTLALAVSAVVLGAGLALLLGSFSKASAMVQGGWQVWLTAALCVWVLGWMGWDLRDKTRHAADLPTGLKRLGRSYWGMVLAHAGLLVLCLGVALTHQGSIEKDVPLAPGQSVALAGYTFRLERFEQIRKDNYDATRATVSVQRDGQLLTRLYPEKRLYIVQRRPMTEAAIDASLLRDLYVSLGEPLDARHPEGAWAVRVYVKPYVRWLWLSAILMALGAALCMLDPRYRLRRPQMNAASAAELNLETRP